MSTIPEDRHRSVIPRLRSFITTLALGELDASTTRVQVVDAQSLDSLESNIKAWRKNQTVPFAADVVSSAFVLNRTNDVRDAAKFLLLPTSQAPQAAKIIASKILAQNDGRSAREQLVGASADVPSVTDVRSAVHVLRLRVADEPRNGLLWTELAREYALVGLYDKAERAMDVAVSLSRANRFVLRSAARLYLHIGRPGKAHYVLMRSDAIRYDPWLLSAEIAVASAVKLTSKHVTTGRRMLKDDSLLVFHKNELASAIGTLELHNGKIKSARDLFKSALAAPTENSVAQVEWAQRQQHIPGLDTDLERMRIETPRSFEARAWDHLVNLRWQEAFDESFQWFYDQPFSSRPVLFGSFIGGCILEDFNSTERLLRYGLTANPNDTILLNNLAFTYASFGAVDSARKEFDKIEQEQVKETAHKIAITATKGLLEFRSGNLNAGRTLYRQAIALATGEEFRTSRALAAIYLAKEEVLAATENAERASEEASREIKRLSSPESDYCQLIFQRVRDFADQQPSSFEDSVNNQDSRRRAANQKNPSSSK